jgi:putative addiction module killer protein
MGDNALMDIKQTEAFTKWLDGVRDNQAKAAIALRIRRVTLGNLGAVRSVGKGVSEIKVDVGQGYRVYFTIRGQVVVILLCGGTKSSQSRDIEKAHNLAILY